MPAPEYVNTFILVAPDCPAENGLVPASAKAEPTIAQVEYALLEEPYRRTQPEVLFETWLTRQGLAPSSAERRALWDEFFEKSRACLRASPLPKKFGWGIHFDGRGRAALYARESDEYRAFAAGEHPGVKVVAAMRSKRA